MDAQTLFRAVKSIAAEVYSAEGLERRLMSGRRLRVKFGADPSRPDLTLGHSVPLRMLKLFQEGGHEIVFVVGDFTGMIGDPTGRSKTRPSLTLEQTRENGRTYCEQAGRILDIEKCTVTYNSQWLSPMYFEEVLRLCGTYTLARIMERNDFAARWAENRPVGVHELLYPLIQGYDSVDIKADIEIGGTDQTYNMLVGRDIQQDYGQEQQEVITVPLIAGLDGVEKMSKSLGNYIGITEPPGVMYEKCMKVPDNWLAEYFRLTTDEPAERYKDLVETDVRRAHFLYADVITAMYHGAEERDRARRRYFDVAAGGQPEEIGEVVLGGGECPLYELVARAGLAPSNAEARRLIKGGGIALDGIVVYDCMYTPSGREFVLRRGKSKFVRMKLDG